MISYLKVLGDKESDLSNEERNLLSVAYKNAVGQRRTAWRAVSAIGQNPKYSQYSGALNKYKTTIEDEMEKICNDLVTMVDSSFLGKASTDDSKVFFNKMKADYYRYLSEVSSGERLASVSDKALACYSAAQEGAKSLGAANPVKLGLALNYSVFYYEVRQDHKKACELAKECFDEAINQLDNLEED